jgi:hypothetical protein
MGYSLLDYNADNNGENELDSSIGFHFARF